MNMNMGKEGEAATILRRILAPATAPQPRHSLIPACASSLLSLNTDVCRIRRYAFPITPIAFLDVPQPHPGITPSTIETYARPSLYPSNSPSPSPLPSLAPLAPPFPLPRTTPPPP